MITAAQQLGALLLLGPDANPEDCSWLLTWEGDWHCLSNAAAVFVDLLQDAGGSSDNDSSSCSSSGSEYQDLHNDSAREFDDSADNSVFSE